MAYSKVGICNLAFALVGASAIRDFDESNKRARMAEVFYEPTRDYLLSKFDWPFARSFKNLQKLSTTDIDVPEGMNAFKLPNDCRTPRDIHPLGSRVKWEVYGSALLTPEESVGLYYTKQETNPTRFSDTFVNVLALGLAIKMAPSITQDKQLVQSLVQQYEMAKMEAWESDANIGNMYREHDEDPNNDRFVYPDGVPDLPRIIT